MPAIDAASSLIQIERAPADRIRAAVAMTSAQRTYFARAALVLCPVVCVVPSTLSQHVDPEAARLVGKEFLAACANYGRPSFGKPKMRHGKPEVAVSGMRGPLFVAVSALLRAMVAGVGLGAVGFGVGVFFGAMHVLLGAPVLGAFLAVCVELTVLLPILAWVARCVCKLFGLKGWELASWPA